MRYLGPKNKIARREGIDLGLKTPGSNSHSGLLRRINIIPGQHGKSRRKRMSDYGLQLREKQKLKRIYGISEKQMKIYFEKSSRKIGNTAEYIIQSLERRLDNVIHRLGFAPTKASARQLVVHGHITINNKKVTIPSYQVAVSDIISFKKQKTTKIPCVAVLLDKKDFVIPKWFAKKGVIGKIKKLPILDDFKEDVDMQAVIEFYSR